MILPGLERQAIGGQAGEALAELGLEIEVLGRIGVAVANRGVRVPATSVADAAEAAAGRSDVGLQHRVDIAAE